MDDRERLIALIYEGVADEEVWNELSLSWPKG
jgi:hypothetical protein